MYHLGPGNQPPRMLNTLVSYEYLHQLCPAPWEELDTLLQKFRELMTGTAILA